ncbi:phenylalanine--tRNA ligase subunit beta [Legionella jordanis]|uniref:Phenylalanine--tRNA ligase beta subunit n=1 Tax=Legionella jordanis TaxID=456 RepID=A0A0W0VBP0_9GAMM|nr:phenylalanine--tRNA ligase subunit beta [Legionella jordanis]KTD17541.1 phenylalanyl-tRNA synthetase, beta subunit [Legionella jordanis]RMX05121.1 phenylalanine--tRNA ligase subunit beta [Legionella jordanis]RMX17377.1 phenylalanine--tRNA ligase subunit beta [Legionella jordanis]VEH13510.1 phenylalanyl-tRNA synthetase, beta subunit [Legionella jordanis]
MKVSELWLREWVNPALEGEQLASLLTMAGLEVDSVSSVAGSFNAVVVAEVLNTMPHPQADKLTLCEVNDGTGKTLKVVCGASNVRSGLKVALARVGAHLPGGLTIKESTLRGELSQGMLCSMTELGLAEQSDGIMELAPDAPVGEDLRSYLALDDLVFDIDLTPNRADCLSVLGVAREVGALTNTVCKSFSEKKIKPSIDEKMQVKLQEPEACPQYAGRVLRGINVKASTPVWMSEKLRRSGLRAIHPVVDVTNYVMLELGQPMHAFDLTKLQGDIQVRFAQKDERLELLDGQMVQLQDNVLVIADEQKALAMAGIMGGKETAVEAQTTDIFLESAFFNPLNIAGVARKYGLFTDSSQRFERGVDPELQVLALERATELLLEIVGGEAGPVHLVNEPSALPKRAKVLFHPARVEKITGLAISHEEMVNLLSALGMTVTQKDGLWEVDIPSHRFDVSLEVDLIEEIARLHGYDKLSGSKMLTEVQAGTIDPIEGLSTRISQFFRSRGYHETISYSFVDPELQAALYPESQTMQLLNPISSELSQMRVSMWPGLIASMIHNIHRQQTAIKFFESGVTFELDKDKQLTEHFCLAGLLTGAHGVINWSESSAKFDFFDAKGDLQALFAILQLKDVHFIAAQHPALHPGKSACIEKEGVMIGFCGVLHPKIADALDLQDEVILFELRLASLLASQPPKYQAISKYPQIRRDLSFLVANDVSAGEIEAAVREVVNSEQLKSFDVFDVYKGDNVPQDKKSLAIALTLQDENRTMVDSEINAIISAILKKLNEKFAIILRD